MIPPSSSKFRFQRFLDAIASRLGIYSAIGVLILICVGMGTYLQSVVIELDKSLVEFEDQQVRNGYVAMSDVQRLVLVAHQAVNAGVMSKPLATEFRTAADILYVRANHFRQLSEGKENSFIKNSALATLDEIVALADDTVSNDFQDCDLVFKKLISLSSKARENLVQFLDEMRRQADLITEQQAGVMRHQQFVVLANLAGLTLVGSGALLLLRREVLERRGREIAERRSEFLAYFDSLTEIPNRIQFQDKLAEYIQSGAHFALIFIDLDEFKQINDTKGHSAGDATLKHVGRILQDAAENNFGFAARLGGDEFAFIVPTVDLVSLENLCKELLDKGSRYFDYEKGQLKLSFSIGLATSKMIEGSASVIAEALSRATDFALYVSKDEGRNRFTIYDETLEKRFRMRREMLDELLDAIANNALEVHYQPKVNLINGETFGFEALVRWRRNGDLVGPDDFIKLAEESDLVLDIDRFVLNRASSQVSEINRTSGSNFSVSVNLSAHHFASCRIVTWIKEALCDSDLQPTLLTLEITETVEMLDWKSAGEVIAEIRNLGCNIAIDDFGSGYSSLSYLYSTSPDELKIDRSLIIELETSAKARLLLKSVFEIARNLRMDVTVEGIESSQQASILLSMGAKQGQGYLFGRPLIAELAFDAAMLGNATSTLKLNG